MCVDYFLFFYFFIFIFLFVHYFFTNFKHNDSVQHIIVIVSYVSGAAQNDADNSILREMQGKH